MNDHQVPGFGGDLIVLVPKEQVAEENLAAKAKLADRMRAEAGYVICASR